MTCHGYSEQQVCASGETQRDLAAYFLLGLWMSKMKVVATASHFPVGYSDVQDEGGGGSCPNFTQFILKKELPDSQVTS